jgi:hypothetical protein
MKKTLVNAIVALGLGTGITPTFANASRQRSRRVTSGGTAPRLLRGPVG